MPVTRREQLQQLDGDNTEIDPEERHAWQVPRLPVRKQFLEVELEWAVNVPDRCDPDVNADHQIVRNLTARARICFGTGFNPQEHNMLTSNFILGRLQYIFVGTLIDEAYRR